MAENSFPLVHQGVLQMAYIFGYSERPRYMERLWAGRRPGSSRSLARRGPNATISAARRLGGSAARRLGGSAAGSGKASVDAYGTGSEAGVASIDES
jgi:hypothetical protein